MSRIIKAIQKSFLRKYFLSLSIRLNNYSYKLIKKFLTAPGEIHPKHRIINYNKFFIERVSPEDVVLDIGSFKGETCFALAPRVKRMIGIEIEEWKTEEAKRKNNFSNVEFVCGDATAFDFSSLGISKFDKVIISNVLEHIVGRVEFLKKMAGLTDVVLLRVPMLDRDWLTVYKKEKDYEYRLDPDHKIEYTEAGLEEEIASAGWKIKEKIVRFGETWAVLDKR